MRNIVRFGFAGVFALCAGPLAVEAGAPGGQRDLASVCARIPCRTAIVEFRLTDDQGGTFILNTERLPYVEEGRVTLFAGETILVGFPPAGVDNPRFLRAANGIAAGPPRSIAIQLQQDAGKPDMILSVQSTLDTPLAFDASLFVPTPNGMGSRRVTSCLAAANGVTRQTWPYAIAMVVLNNFRVPVTGASDCR